MRLIDADALYDSVAEKWDNDEITNGDWVLIRQLIVDAPTINTVNYTRAFVTEKFRELYTKKWKAKRKTQKDFAKAMKLADPTMGINESYVSKLLHGVYSPNRYLPIICQVLEVDITEFIPKKGAII